jgi:protein-S-isoprenylcysteine O-methyltransferase Ste14
MHSDQSSDQVVTPAVDGRLKARFLIRETIGVAIIALILFLCAGTVNWPMGWLLVAITALWVAGTTYVLFTRQPGLIAERLGPRKGGKSWDMALMSIVGIGNVARLVVAGLDFRFGWSDVPFWLQVAGMLMVLLGYALMVWATAANAFFSQIVRIQEERGHTVATGGPYRFMRHPGYSGTLLNELGSPLMLASWWALIPGAIDAVVMIVRTAKEDSTLQAELPGYSDYAQSTRHRLVPGIW